MNEALTRRQFLKTSAITGLAGAWMASGCASYRPLFGKKPIYEISLAEWSLHRAILRDRRLTNLDFPKTARREFEIDAVEYVNQMFFDKAKDQPYLNELKNVCDGEGVRSLLIMCDREGALGDPDEQRRKKAVENHYKWADAAKFLGCHSIRVNAQTNNEGSFAEQMEKAADGLRQLSEHCAPMNLNVLVENHGGLSSHGAWLAGVMAKVGLPNCGTLPDFGNFGIRQGETYDRYKGVRELMPYAKAVSAKSHQFDEQGNEANTDYHKMMQIVLDAGYRGYVGVEYEGGELDEYAGIRATKDLLVRVREQLSSLYKA